jgi:hypothetical protein
MKCSNPDCNRGIGLAAYRRGWFSKRRYCSRNSRDAVVAIDHAERSHSEQPPRATGHPRSILIAFYPKFDPLMDELNRRGAVIFVHPSALAGNTVPAVPAYVADFLLDTVRAAINLRISAFGGKADFPPDIAECLLLTQSGHSRFQPGS